MALYSLPSPNSRFVPMKYILILYMCSINTGKCPSNSISPYEFDSHFDCVTFGYGLAQQTYKNLLTLKDYDLDTVNKNKLVIKFECRGLKSENI